MVDFKNIKTIMFDLGEVIVDLNPKAVIDKMSEYVDIDPALDMKEVIVNSPLLIEYETGKISEEVFLEGMNRLLKSSMKMDQFVGAWNLMLKQIPEERLDLVQRMGEKYQTLILSNTNGIHQLKFDEMIRSQTGREGLHTFVETAHYSHHIGERKPDDACYHYVIKSSHLDPEKTLFLDDNPFNIASAKRLGIQAVKVDYPDQIFEILADA